MELKYTGPKETKTIEYNNKIFVFTPTCDVTDIETLKFLLHSDRKGLFVKATPEEAKAAVEENKGGSAEPKGKPRKPRKPRKPTKPTKPEGEKKE